MAIRPDAVRVFAPAKINLNLHVIGQRADGFHALQSLVAFADAGDVLTVAADDALSLGIEGPFAQGLAGEADNLVLRAAKALAAAIGRQPGARFVLTKNLPVASGIGGGSADAAAALRALAALWRIAPDGRLEELAASLGSDVPVCVESAAAWMEGRGERVTHLADLPTTHIVLVNPGVGVATAAVFRGLASKNNPPAPPLPARFATLDALLGWLALTRNDLETPARAMAPIIGTVLEALSAQGARLARMSGSGATCFAIFASGEAAQTAAAAIARAEPGWWVTASKLVAAEAARPVRQ